MIVEAYGITLKRLTAEYLELVRGHRNSEAIRNTMEYREIITAEMQQQWFAGIDNEHNNYMLIFVEDKPIGLISGTQIDWEKGITGNGGIFIWDKDFIETIHPARAAILLTDIGFYLGMKKNQVKILSDNLRSISFNTSLGYQLLPGQEGVYNQQYELTAERYFPAVEKLRSMTGTQGIIKGRFDDPNHVSSANIINRLAKFEDQLAGKFEITVQRKDVL